MEGPVSISEIFSFLKQILTALFTLVHCHGPITLVLNINDFLVVDFETDNGSNSFFLRIDILSGKCLIGIIPIGVRDRSRIFNLDLLTSQLVIAANIACVRVHLLEADLTPNGIHHILNMLVRLLVLLPSCENFSTTS